MFFLTRSTAHDQNTNAVTKTFSDIITRHTGQYIAGIFCVIAVISFLFKWIIIGFAAIAAMVLAILPSILNVKKRDYERAHRVVTKATVDVTTNAVENGGAIIGAGVGAVIGHAPGAVLGAQVGKVAAKPVASIGKDISSKFKVDDMPEDEKMVREYAKLVLRIKESEDMDFEQLMSIIATPGGEVLRSLTPLMEQGMDQTQALVEYARQRLIEYHNRKAEPPKSIPEKIEIVSEQ